MLNKDGNTLDASLTQLVSSLLLSKERPEITKVIALVFDVVKDNVLRTNHSQTLQLVCRSWVDRKSWCVHFSAPIARSSC